MIQPASRPNRIPAMPNAIPSDFMRNARSYLGALERRHILTDHTIEADEHRTRNDGVTDGHLIQVRQHPEERQVLEIEIVAGVDAEACVVRDLRRPGKHAE